MGVMPDIMLKLTPGEILRYYRGYQLRQTKEWERARFLAWFVVRPHDSKNSLPTPYSIMELETDPSAEEIEAMKRSEEDEALAIIKQYKERGLI